MASCSDTASCILINVGILSRFSRQHVVRGPFAVGAATGPEREPRPFFKYTAELLVEKNAVGPHLISTGALFHDTAPHIHATVRSTQWQIDRVTNLSTK